MKNTSENSTIIVVKTNTPQIKTYVNDKMVINSQSEKRTKGLSMATWLFIFTSEVIHGYFGGVAIVTGGGHLGFWSM